MKIILKTINLPDGRVCQYHKILEVIFSSTLGKMKVLMGSWSTIEAALSQASPEATTAIDMTYTGAMDTATYDLIERIIETPEWAGSKLLDTTQSTQTTKPIIELPEVL